jgi:hypothetical protein
MSRREFYRGPPTESSMTEQTTENAGDTPVRGLWTTGGVGGDTVCVRWGHSAAENPAVSV